MKTATHFEQKERKDNKGSLEKPLFPLRPPVKFACAPLHFGRGCAVPLDNQNARLMAFLKAVTNFQKLAVILFLRNSLVLQPGANKDSR